MEVKNIPLVRIHTSPLNPRKTINEGDLLDLALNIKNQGLLQPITVRPIPPNDINPVGGDFEIVMGERRYRAVSLLNKNYGGDDTIACLVKEMSDADALDAMITENLQRKDVDPIEEAAAFGQLNQLGKSIDEIANRFGKSKRFIAERIKLDQLIPELKTCVSKGWIAIGAALHICKLTEEEQKEFYDRFEWDDDGDDVVTKGDAVEFTNDLFMNISRADWEDDFAGSCGTTCAKCPFNNANVGCLFYEMKEHDATCTNRAKWDKKRNDWMMHIIDHEADVLVKGDGELESGKTVVATCYTSYYSQTPEKFNEFVDMVRERGYKVVQMDDLFGRYSSYYEDDPRAQEKLAKGSVYRVVAISNNWRGIEVNIRLYEFKKDTTGESSEQGEAMKLVEQYKENIRKADAAKSNKIGECIGMMSPDNLSDQPLDDVEQFLLYVYMMRYMSTKYREMLGIKTYGNNDAVCYNYAKEHPELMHRVARDFIRAKLCEPGCQYNSDLQAMQNDLAKHWINDEITEALTAIDVKLAKKQDKIVDELTALGYDTEGKKLAF